MGILFNSTALGIHFCETSLIFNFKTRLGGEICLCDVNMHKGYCENTGKILKISCVRCHFVKFDINIIFLGSHKKFSLVLLQVTNKYYIYSP